MIESFLDKVGKEIDRRVDSRLATQQPQSPVQAHGSQSKFGSPFALAIVSMVMGIPLTGISAGAHWGVTGVIVIWLGLALINVVYALPHRDR